MRQPYYDAIGVEPSYSNGDLLEQVYDDRQLNEEPETRLDWEILELENSEAMLE